VNDYKVALFFHLIGVLLFVAGIGLAGVAFEVGRRQTRPGEIALLLGMTRTGVLLVGVGSLLLGIFGLWLVHLGDFGYRAVGLAIDRPVVVALCLGTLGGQRPKQARHLAAQLQADNAPVTAALRELLDDRLSRYANCGSPPAVLAVLVLMVFKR